ncbi:MAG: hypothetical protein ABI220_02185 [Candidatus Saccharimonadales bacterium]
MASDSSSQGSVWVGLAFIVVVIVIIVVLVKLSHKRTRGKYWIGKVTDKRISKSTDEDGETTVTNLLLVTMDGATKPKKFAVNAALYNQFAVGDKIEKKLGELNPSKVA